MKLVHMVFGLAVLVVFVLTGQDMALYHGHLGGMADGPRMLYRSRHIYILLASLLNLGLGAYLTRGLDRRTQILQVVGSGAIILATCLLVAAFFFEAPTGEIRRITYARNGIFLMLGGTMTHVIASMRYRSKQ
jgi:hypothetical protein